MSTIKHLAAAWHLSSVGHPAVPWYPCGVDRRAVMRRPCSVHHLVVTTTPLNRQPPGCARGKPAASTALLSLGTRTASITWLSKWHHPNVDHLAVTIAPLQHRPPGCHHGTTPASTIWLSPGHHSSVDHLAVTMAPLQCRSHGWHHCYTSPDPSTLPHDGDHRRSRTSPHLSPLSPVPKMAHSSMWRCWWDAAVVWGG